jgi:FlaA1/EpsC-like NDP-sugar epimerase
LEAIRISKKISYKHFNYLIVLVAACFGIYGIYTETVMYISKGGTISLDVLYAFLSIYLVMLVTLSLSNKLVGVKLNLLKLIVLSLVLTINLIGILMLQDDKIYTIYTIYLILIAVLYSCSLIMRKRPKKYRRKCIKTEESLSK